MQKVNLAFVWTGGDISRGRRRGVVGCVGKEWKFGFALRGSLKTLCVPRPFVFQAEGNTHTHTYG